MTRVIQWATGVTGTMALRHVIGRPDLELVGVRVYDPAKAGLDAGALCGLPDTGVTATDDRDVLIDADADVVLYMGKVEIDTPGCFADVCDLLASGKNVVATGKLGSSIRARWTNSLADGIEDACRKGSSSFLGLGLFPGFVGESIAPVLSRLTARTSRIDVREVLNYSTYASHDLIFNAMGFGHAPDDTTPLADQHRLRGQRLDRHRNRARGGAGPADPFGRGLPRCGHDATGACPSRQARSRQAPSAPCGSASWSTAATPRWRSST